MGTPPHFSAHCTSLHSFFIHKNGLHQSARPRGYGPARRRGYGLPHVRPGHALRRSHVPRPHPPHRPHRPHCPHPPLRCGTILPSLVNDSSFLLQTSEDPRQENSIIIENFNSATQTLL